MKLDLYKDYVTALSSQLSALTATQTQYVDAANALTLVAPHYVLEALYAFNDVLFLKEKGNLGESIQGLLRALRADILPLQHKDHNFELRLFRKSSTQTIDSPSAVASK